MDFIQRERRVKRSKCAVPDDEERDEIDVGEVRAAAGGRVRPLGVVALGVADNVGPLEARQHDLLPRLARRRPKQHQDRLEERLEVVVAVDLGALLGRDLAEHLQLTLGKSRFAVRKSQLQQSPGLKKWTSHLHPDDSVDEEYEGD